MSDLVFPALRGRSLAAPKTLETATLIQSAPNRATLRISQTYNPIWHWELAYEFLGNDPDDLTSGLSYSDLQTLWGFIALLGGPAEDFLYQDPDDFHVGPGVVGGSPNLAAQLQVVTDGEGNYYSPIQRNLGGLFLEDVTDLNGLIKVYADGTLQTLNTHYTVDGPGLALPGQSFLGLYLTWLDHGSPVTKEPDQPVTAEFDFYFRVRFEEDKQMLARWLDKVWGGGGGLASFGGDPLKLVSSRPGQV